MRNLVVGLLLFATLVAPDSASADECHEVDVAQVVQGLIEVSSVIRCGGPSRDTGTEQNDNQAVSDIGSLACFGLANLLRESYEEFCGGDPAEPRVTSGSVAAAFRRVPIPPARLIVQPPNGRTLVNFATNFYTEREEFTRNVRLLGRRVQLRITPAQFTWHFDDGKTVTTSTPGAPYPKLEITHDYLEKGGVSPRVDTTYTAVFRVGRGGWQPVPGSVTITGEPVALEIVEASPLLVGYE